MRGLLFVALLVLATVCVVSAKRKKAPEARSAASSGRFANRPKVKGGRVMFDEEEDVVLSVRGKQTRRSKMRKVNAGPDNPAFAMKKAEQAAVYADEEDTVVCRKDCDENGDCEQYCVEHNEDESCFILDGKAVCMDNIAEPLVDVVVPTPDDLNNGSNPRRMQSPKGRNRRSLVPDLNSAGIIRASFHFDDAFMDTFKAIAGGDANAAVTAATKFVKLIANEMTISFQSFKEFGRTYTFGGVTRNLDFAVYLANIEFPQITNNEFSSVSWSSNSGVSLDDFRSYIRYTFSDPVPIDHYAALAGNSIGGNTIGVAWLNTLCRRSAKNSGLTTAINVQYGMMARLMAHELGHNMGMNHDAERGCPTQTHVMSAAITYPQLSTRDTYFKFSSCSADYAQTYFSGISTSDIDSGCLYNSGVSDEDFRANFCLGFRGTGLTLEEICKTAYGSTSTVCSGSLTSSGYVTNCLPNLSSYGCTTSNGGCTRMNDPPPGTKCSTDNTLGDKICYEGQCVSGVEICPTVQGTTTTTTAGPTTTTVAPTTTTVDTTTNTAGPTTTTVAPTTTTVDTTTTTAGPTSTTIAPTTTTVASTTFPVSTTTTPFMTTTTAQRCRCRSRRCCSRSTPPCCRGCRQTRRGRCVRRRRRWG